MPSAAKAATPPPKRKKEEQDPLLTRTGGAYIPPARLRMMQEAITDKASAAYQRLTWEALKKSINGLVNKVRANGPLAPWCWPPPLFCHVLCGLLLLLVVSVDQRLQYIEHCARVVPGEPDQGERCLYSLRDPGAGGLPDVFSCLCCSCGHHQHKAAPCRGTHHQASDGPLQEELQQEGQGVVSS